MGARRFKLLPLAIVDSNPQLAGAPYDATPQASAKGFSQPGEAARIDPLETSAVRVVVIENVSPLIDGGRHAVKRIAGDTMSVEADVFRDGHGRIAGALLYRERGANAWQETALVASENDRWHGSFVAANVGAYEYTLEAWPDPFATWRRDLAAKLEVKQPVALELMEGRTLVAGALARASGEDRTRLEALLRDFDRRDGDEGRSALLLGDQVIALLARQADRTAATRFEPVLRVEVDRAAAQFAAWYELFVRSQGTTPDVAGNFADAERRLPEIRAMGFDVVYLPPIHPIGRAFRKGRNNELECRPDDPGSPWAIGNENGGHTAIEPSLGTLADFDRFIAAARDNELEVALDYALQCSPDHPFVAEHPEWFNFRPDGSLKYAENPPKKYQDIVNFSWTGPHVAQLWAELRDIVLFWIGHGVRIFRVDNPHTKPFAFWEWMIADVRARHPDTIFLAEAFTRPKVMAELAKLGFSQSYTYFTWRNTKAELTEYVTELAQTELAEFYRPNFWPNTPDILSPFLQTGGRPAFRIRLVLAATLASTYGIYSGYELCEDDALLGREEYLNSEKFEIKVRDWNAPGNIRDDIAAINRIRRENPALHDWRHVSFYRADDDAVLFYGKRSGDNVLLVAVNLDPLAVHDPLLWLPTGDLGIADDEPYAVEELLGATKHVWRGSPHRWRLDPQLNPAAVFRLKVTA